MNMQYENKNNGTGVENIAWITYAYIHVVIRMKGT